MNFKRVTDNLTGYVALIVLIVSTIFGAYFFIDVTYAKSESVKKIYQMIEEDRTERHLEKIQARMWKLQDRFGELLEKASATVKEEFRNLKLKKEKLKKKLDSDNEEEE